VAEQLRRNRLGYGYRARVAIGGSEALTRLRQHVSRASQE
jgi:hypothetical protein